ncbi:hypothetical protein P0136_00360 [Lentisphaerota bacterium ZTH]|nr:hypothetical protein JYG24_08495 [Lentisphaerota bacterium]WET06469.1 hypothetical protein P0136_00360 [Lentisphaerota bacterium ZTH]
MSTKRVKCANCGNRVSSKCSNNTVICPKCGWEWYINSRRITSLDINYSLDPRNKMHFCRPQDFSILLVALPVIITIFAWLAMPLLLNKVSLVMLIYGYITTTILSTAVLAAVELNLARVNQPEISLTSSVAWLTAFILLWPLTFPMYMFHRRVYLLKNNVIAGVFISLLVTVTAASFWLKSIVF